MIFVAYAYFNINLCVNQCEVMASAEQINY